MSLPYRHNNRWTIPELLTLQRDYELLEMTITEIAEKHERTVNAILCKLQSEEFITSWNDARGYEEYVSTLIPVKSIYDHGITNNLGVYVTDDDDEVFVENNEQYDEEYICDNDSDSDYEQCEIDEKESLNQRVWGLETAVSEIKNLIGTLLTKVSGSPTKPLKKLRQTPKQEQQSSEAI
jgi:hypothetical protein